MIPILLTDHCLELFVRFFEVKEWLCMSLEILRKGQILLWVSLKNSHCVTRVYDNHNEM